MNSNSYKPDLHILDDKLLLKIFIPPATSRIMFVPDFGRQRHSVYWSLFYEVICIWSLLNIPICVKTELQWYQLKYVLYVWSFPIWTMASPTMGALWHNR